MASMRPAVPRTIRQTAGSQTAISPRIDYQTALDRWLNRQQQARGMYAGAAEPLQANIEAFQPGGGFGAGRIAMLEEEARRTGARATAEQVASGMSSGSLATSTGLRIGSDLARAKLGVEDVRTQFLTQARQSLAGLRGQEAGQVGATADPYFSTFQSAQTAQRGQTLGAISAAETRSVQRQQLATARKEADRQYQLQVKQFEAAQKKLDSKHEEAPSGGYKSLQF